MKITYTIGIFGKEFETLSDAKEALKAADDSYLNTNGHREADGTRYIHAFVAETGKKAHIYSNGSATVWDENGSRKVSRYSEKRLLGTEQPAESEA